MTNPTVTVPDLKPMGRKLWEAARRIALLEHEVETLRAQRRQLATLVQSLLEGDDIKEH